MVVEALSTRGADVVALTRREVDATDRAGVRVAIEGCDAMVDLAGPFLRTGLTPFEAAIDARVPIVDTTGEQAFMLLARERLHARAKDAGVPIVNAMGFEYALGDLAARAHFPDGGEALHVFYRSPGARGSAGTKKSILRVMGAPTRSWEDGRLARVGAARYHRAFETTDGMRTGVSFAGGECVTVPTHTPFRTVRTYIATRHTTRARLLAPLARVALRGPVLRAAERYVDAKHRAPRNEAARGEVHLVREREAGAGIREHVVVTTPDPYLATAHIAAEGAMRLVGSTRGGVLAPAEAYAPSAFLEALAKAMPDFGVDGLSGAS